MGCNLGYFLLERNGFYRPTNLPSQEGFEPFPKPFSNHSCVPLVASGKAEREQGLIDYGQKPPFIKVFLYGSQSLCPFGASHGFYLALRATIIMIIIYCHAKTLGERHAARGREPRRAGWVGANARERGRAKERQSHLSKPSFRSRPIIEASKE